jgi:phospholipid N-methyltransferase
MGLKDRYIFLQKLFHQPKVNASVTPSSRFLAQAMIQGIDFSRVKTVIEFGP